MIVAQAPEFAKVFIAREGRIEGMRAAPPWLPTIARFATAMRYGALTAVLADGREVLMAGREAGPEAVLIAHDDRIWRDLALGGDIALAEAYRDGRWSTPDLTQLIELGAVNNAEIGASLTGSLARRLANRLSHLWRFNSRRGARDNIHAHYDLGNAFYACWLDRTMTYSSALYAAPDQRLSEAQENKYRALGRRMGLQAGERVLEIGGGWGGFAEWAAKEADARVTALTISPAQHAFASARMQREGLNEKVEIRLQDYRDADGQYDRIASIEMFEAVGERYWPVYFDRLRERLKPGGVAGLQIITISDRYFPTYRKGADFIQRYIFPGGMLPSPNALDAEIARAGLKLEETAYFGRDYALTLAEWRRRFLAAWPNIKPLGFDDSFRRLWEYYLSYCEAGFRAGNTDVAQLAVRRV